MSGISQYSQGQTDRPSQPISKDSIISLINELDLPIDRLTKLHRNLVQIGDALHGTRPSDTKEPGQLSEPTSIIEGFRTKHQRLNYVLTMCEEETVRVLSGIVPA